MLQATIMKIEFKKQDALKERADEFSTTVEEIQRKVHNLRNQFNSEFKKHKNPRSGLSTMNCKCLNGFTIICYYSYKEVQHSDQQKEISRQVWYLVLIQGANSTNELFEISRFYS